MSTMTPLTYEILLALADGACHGYGIIKEIEGRGAVAPSTGALYLALQRMERDGSIEDAPTPEGSDVDRRRRYYRLTARGRDLAESESQRLAALVSAAQAKKLLTATGPGDA